MKPDWIASKFSWDVPNTPVSLGVSHYSRVFDESSEERRVLADVFGLSSNDAKSKAKLIAAAPDLLDALKEAKNELTFLFAQQQNEKFWNESSEIRLAKIREAIEKATA